MEVDFTGKVERLTTVEKTSNHELISVSDIAINPAWNRSRGSNVKAWFNEKESQIQLATLLANGWNENSGGIAAVCTLSNGEVEAEIARREALMDELARNVQGEWTTKFIPDGSAEEKKVTITTGDYLAVLREAYLVKNKMVKPRFSSALAMRRTMTWLMGQAIHRRCGLPLNLRIPCAVWTFDEASAADQLQRGLMNIQENELKSAGVLKTTRLQKLLAGVVLFRQGFAECRLTPLFGRYTSQIISAVSNFDLRYPQFDLLADIISGQITEEMVNRIEATPMRKAVEANAPAHEAEEIIKKLGVRKNAKKMMSKTDIEAYASNVENLGLKMMATAILDNDRSVVELATHPAISTLVAADWLESLRKRSVEAGLLPQLNALEAKFKLATTKAPESN